MWVGERERERNMVVVRIEVTAKNKIKCGILREE